MSKRKIDHLLMHDAAIELYGETERGWLNSGHSEQYVACEPLAEWLHKGFGIYKLPTDSPMVARQYQGPEVHILAIRGDVIAPNTLDLEIDMRTLGGKDTWTERVTYCGGFTVWWGDEP